MDGDIDVINSEGQIWLNDGAGNFAFQPYNYNINNLIADGTYMGGSGVCAGDFNNTGRPQVVITDVSNTAQGLPIADTIIFELNASLQTIDYHVLPVPVIDRGATVEGSHDVSCRVADLNSDGKLDIVVYSRPSDKIRNGMWTDEGRVQVLLNQGGWVFNDVTDSALVGYPTNVLVTYSGVIKDLNSDGKLDLWMGYFDGTSGLANQAWINNGNGVFQRAAKSSIDALGSNGPMLPLKITDGWRFLFSKNNGRGYDFYVTNKAFAF